VANSEDHALEKLSLRNDRIVLKSYVHGPKNKRSKMRRLSLRSYGLPDVLFKIMLNAPMPLGIETTLTGCAREKNFMLKKCGINIKT